MGRLCAVLSSRQAFQIRRLLVGSHGTYSFVVTVRAVPAAGMVYSRVYCRDPVLRSRLLVVGVALIVCRVLLCFLCRCEPVSRRYLRFRQPDAPETVRVLPIASPRRASVDYVLRSLLAAPLADWVFVSSGRWSRPRHLTAANVARVDLATRRALVRRSDVQIETEGITDLLRADEVGGMPPQDRPDRVARKSRPPCGSYRGLPGLSQPFPQEHVSGGGLGRRLQCGVPARRRRWPRSAGCRTQPAARLATGQVLSAGVSGRPTKSAPKRWKNEGNAPEMREGMV